MRRLSSSSPSLPALSSALLALALCVAVAAAQRAPPSAKIKGMAFTSGHNVWAYKQPFATRSLRQLRSTGTRYIHITVILGLESVTSFNVYTKTDERAVRLIIRKCHRMGFRVFLKPIVQTRDLTWRGYIKGSPAWFAKVYNPYITRLAALARDEGVAILSVGSELRSTLPLASEWRKTIAAVRKVFPGWLTYVANHDSYQQVRFWDALDFISISAYFRLLTKERYDRIAPPTLALTRRLWKRQANIVANWRTRAGLTGKKILIAEAGAMSKGNGVTYHVPWEYDVQAPTDLTVQAWQYEGLLEAFMKPKWSLGVMLYEWEARPDAGKRFPTIQTYTPQNKPALAVMRKYFTASYN